METKDIFAIIFTIMLILVFFGSTSYKSWIKITSVISTLFISSLLGFSLYPERYSKILNNYNWIWYITTVVLGAQSIIIFFSKQGKIRTQIEDVPLNKYHISIIEKFLTDNEYYKKNSDLNIEQDISKFIKANQINLGGYIKLKNANDEKTEILSKIYEDNYIEFSLKYLKGIYHLQYSQNGFLLPERIATQLGYLFDSKFDIQLNTSIFNFENFYRLKNNEVLSQLSTENQSERIIIIDDIGDIENTIDDKKVESLNYIFRQSENISYFLWIWEWHKKNNEKLYFVLKPDAEKIKNSLSKKNANSNQSIDSLDFSINYFLYNRNLRTTLVNYPEETQDIDIDIFSKKEKAYKIKITNSDIYNDFFNVLKENHTINIDTILNSHKENNKSIYKL